MCLHFLAPIDCEISHQLERGTSANEDAGSQRGMSCEIPHRLEWKKSASEDVGPRKRMDYEIPYQLERGSKHFFFYITVWKPLPNRHVLKVLRENRKGKTPRELLCAK